jgi:hypothetical protein
MIHTVSEFLECLREQEHAVLKKQNIKHAPTIGDMYEGLTKDLLGRAIPVSSGIDVVSGFITDSFGNLSDELDCMVVLGKGTVVPYTNKKKYLVDDVVAVLQVKKNLYSSDLQSGYSNLASVNQFDPTRDRRITLLQDAFQTTTRRPLPSREELDSLPWEIQTIYHTLVMELVYPARIVFGYDGFKTLSTLRNSFVKFLEKNAEATPSKFGLPVFPDLICCGKHCLVKNNGMPFCSPLMNDGFWPAFVSTTSNPIELMLEIIWTRLVYDKKISATVFDEDDYLPSMLRFIDAIPARDKYKAGWRYRVANFPDSFIDSPTPSSDRWEPVFLDQTQFIIINRLCVDGYIDITESGFERFVIDSGYTVESLINSLNKAGLCASVGDQIVLLTRGCSCAILPDGRFAAGENIAGQFNRWIGHQYA